MVLLRAFTGTENCGKTSLIEKLIQRKRREFALPQIKQKNALSFNHMSAVDEATEGLHLRKYTYM